MSSVQHYPLLAWPEETSSQPQPQPMPEACFPIRSFSESIRAVSESLAEVYRVPLCLPCLACLGVLSGAIGKGAEALVDQRGPSRLNMYIGITAERGCGKSGVGSELMRPLTDAARKIEQEWRAEDPKRKAELTLLKKNMTGKKGGKNAQPTSQEITSLAEIQARIDELDKELKHVPRLWFGDATSEALGKALQANGETGFSYSADAGDAIRMACGLRRDKGTDLEMWIKGWTGDAHAQDRITRDNVQLERPCISLLWMVQGILIQELTGNAEAMERGFLARCLIVDTDARPEEIPENPPEFPNSLRQLWSNLTNKFLSFRDASIQILSTTEAKKVIRDFNNEAVQLGRGEYSDVAGELTRWAENAIRVAGIFALVECEEDFLIDEDRARRAVEIVRWCGHRYLRLLTSVRQKNLEEERDNFAEIIRNAGGEINSGKLQSNHGYTGHRRNLPKLLTKLFQERFEMEKVREPGKAGAPPTVFRLRPV